MIGNKALVVLSGGQDSTTALYWAKTRFDVVTTLTFDYGQRHIRELASAGNVASLAGVPLEMIKLGPDILHGRSPLTDHSQSLERYPDFATMDRTIGDRVELTFVPMRNALFLTLAANRAACQDIGNIVTGVCQADNANYPDCRRDFIDQQENTINAALGRDLGGEYIRIFTPLMDLTKAESIDMAVNLKGCMSALALSHTCYGGYYPPCGTCHACVLRAHGFAVANLPDPLLLRACFTRGAPLPTTSNYTDATRNVELAQEWSIA